MSKITLIGINFYPEDTSTGLYTTQMAEYLSENGFDISVITGFPYYPQWEIWKEYKDKQKYLKERHKGIKIYRYKQFTPKNPNFLKRIKHILSFTFGSLKNLKKIENADLIIAIVPFTTDVWLAHRLAKKHNAKVWVHVQDFEFDAAFEAGIIKNRFVQKVMSGILNYFEKNLFDKADILSTISYSMMEKAKTKTKTKLFYLPNWIDEDFINPEKAKSHPYLIGNNFKVLYSGNIGAKQDWERFVDFVAFLKDRKNIEFVVVGDGAKRNWLFSKLENFPNVRLYNPVPYKELSDLLCSADLHILFQKESIIDTVMPSKLLGMMASGKPSLIFGNPQSEIAKVFAESNSGKFFSKWDKMELLKFIEEIVGNPQLSKNYGENARTYVIQNFSKKLVLEKLKNKIHQILKGAYYE